MISINVTLNFYEILTQYLADDYIYYNLTDNEQNELVNKMLKRLRHRIDDLVDQEIDDEEVYVEMYCVIEDWDTYQVTSLTYEKVSEFKEKLEEMMKTAIAEEAERVAIDFIAAREVKQDFN